MSRKVLIIDDEKEVIHIMRKRMEAVGYDVKVAYNGQEGLEVAQKEYPHLILTDVMMPVMDGFAFYNELRRSEKLSRIPVIVATAYGTTQEVFRSLGATDFLLKPFDVQTVLTKLSGFFQSQKLCRVMIATKMLQLMKNILNEIPDMTDRMEIHLTNHHGTFVMDARLFNPDLIILDVALCINPSASNLVSECKKEEDLKHTRILLTRNMLGESLHSRVDQPDKIIEECLAQGASHFIGPLNRASFLSAIENYSHN